jgi:hypothetical protein
VWFDRHSGALPANRQPPHRSVLSPVGHPIVRFSGGASQLSGRDTATASLEGVRSAIRFVLAREHPDHSRSGRSFGVRLQRLGPARRADRQARQVFAGTERRRCLLRAQNGR